MRFLIFSFILLPGLLWAAPNLPHQLYGEVDGAVGDTIRAYIGEEQIGSYTLTQAGSYGRNDLFFLTDQDGVHAGETVSFTISGDEASETLVFNSGALTNLNLSKKTQITTGGSGGSTSPLVEGDFTGDGRVDFADFTQLMILWTTPDGDLTGDGITNLQDVAVLMREWSTS